MRLFTKTPGRGSTLMIKRGVTVDVFCFFFLQPLIVTAFKDNVQMAIVTVVLMIACIYNLSKEGFQMFDEVRHSLTVSRCDMS